MRGGEGVQEKGGGREGGKGWVEGKRGGEEVGKLGGGEGVWEKGDGGEGVGEERSRSLTQTLNLFTSPADHNGWTSVCVYVCGVCVCASAV